MYAQSELNYKIVNAIKTESYDNSQAYEMLNEITTLFGPRLSGTENYMDAATWAKDELESLGLDNVHFESYSDNFRNWSAKSFSIELLKPRYSKINTLPYAWVNQTCRRRSLVNRFGRKYSSTSQAVSAWGTDLISSSVIRYLSLFWSSIYGGIHELNNTTVTKNNGMINECLL